MLSTNWGLPGKNEKKKRIKNGASFKLINIIYFVEDLTLKIIEIQAMGKARENYLQKYPIHLSMYIFLIAAQFEARAISIIYLLSTVYWVPHLLL